MKKLFNFVVKKFTWQMVYIITFVVFTLLLLWGLSGMFRGGGHTFRLFAFYGIIPIGTFTAGVILGLINPPPSKRWRGIKKWLYPIFAGVYAYIIPLAILFVRYSIQPLNLPYFFIPFICAWVGIGIGTFVYNIRPEHKPKFNKIITCIFTVVTVIVLIHIIHATTLDRIIVYREISFYSPNLDPSLDGYRIAFITDPHFISEERLWEVVNELNTREIDLLVLGGDFAPVRTIMERMIEILSYVETTDGIFGVEGNHDSRRLLFAAMESHGIIPLSNSGFHIREGLFLAGLEDLWNRNPDISKALEDSLDEDFVLLITHNPDVTMQQDTTGADLILAGHTHGGQITFFGIWAPYFTINNTLTAYGQRFRAGWAYSHDGTPVFVSRGIGEYLPRVFARPEVVIINLYIAVYSCFT